MKSIFCYISISTMKIHGQIRHWSTEATFLENIHTYTVQYLSSTSCKNEVMTEITCEQGKLIFFIIKMKYSLLITLFIYIKLAMYTVVHLLELLVKENICLLA